MTTSQSSSANESRHLFAYLYPHQFILLTTFRRDGTPVRTTVWFADDNGRLYVTTGSGAGKIKRIHNNGRVLLTPSDARGTTLGQPEIEARAREVTPAEHEQAHAALERKYGEQFRQVLSSPMSQQMSRTYIEIVPAQAEQGAEA